MKGRGIRVDLGTWQLTWPETDSTDDAPDWDTLVLERAKLVLDRYGIISTSLPKLFEDAAPRAQFREAVKQLALKGTAVEGIFVHGIPGQQYALPEAVDYLRETAPDCGAGPVVLLNHHDPANLYSRGVESFDEDGDKVTFGRAGRWYVFVQDGRPIATMYATDSGRDHFAIQYFRFTYWMYRDRTPEVLDAIVEHVRGRMAVAGYSEIRVLCDWHNQEAGSRTFWRFFADRGFEQEDDHVRLVLPLR